MKKYVWMIGVVLLLAGCGAEETLETLSDSYVQAAMAPAAQVDWRVPDSAAAPAVKADGVGELYFCDGYTVTLQTLQSGDLDATLQQVTGFHRDQLTLMVTAQDDAKRYDCVWSCAGEGGDQVGRAAILDDGNYHYVLAVMASEEDAGRLTDTWQALLDSFRLG